MKEEEYEKKLEKIVEF